MDTTPVLASQEPVASSVAESPASAMNLIAAMDSSEVPMVALDQIKPDATSVPLPEQQPVAKIGLAPVSGLQPMPSAAIAKNPIAARPSTDVWFSVAIFLMGIIVALALQQLGGLVGGVHGIDHRHAHYHGNVQQTSYDYTNTSAVVLLVFCCLAFTVFATNKSVFPDKSVPLMQDLEHHGRITPERVPSPPKTNPNTPAHSPLWRVGNQLVHSSQPPADYGNLASDLTAKLQQEVVHRAHIEKHNKLDDQRHLQALANKLEYDPCASLSDSDSSIDESSDEYHEYRRTCDTLNKFVFQFMGGEMDETVDSQRLSERQTFRDVRTQAQLRHTVSTRQIKASQSKPFYASGLKNTTTTAGKRTSTLKVLVFSLLMISTLGQTPLDAQEYTTLQGQHTPGPQNCLWCRRPVRQPCLRPHGCPTNTKSLWLTPLDS